MEVYRQETRQIVDRFLHYRLSFPKCIAALDAALSGVLPELTAEQIAPLRAIALTNNKTVMAEMERR